MWSLGVIVYIMLCGYPPFYSENPRKQLSQGMRRRIMAGEYDFPHHEWGRVSDIAKDVVRRFVLFLAFFPLDRAMLTSFDATNI